MYGTGARVPYMDLEHQRSNVVLTDRIELRVTASQKTAILAAAKAKELSVNEWLRRIIDRGIAGAKR